MNPATSQPPNAAELAMIRGMIRAKLADWKDNPPEPLPPKAPPARVLMPDEQHGRQMLRNYVSKFRVRETLPAPSLAFFEMARDDFPEAVPIVVDRMPLKVAPNWQHMTAEGRATIAAGDPATMREVRALRAEVAELRAAVFELAELVGTIAGGQPA